ncbi:MAG: hypothetical protein RIS64_811 [Bacteroidota bacterium]|jgi:RNA polymerase sigma factor (sigma-70 family)
MFAKKKDFWASAYHQNAPKLLALCRRYVSDAGKAEDLMHDAFITAIHKQGQFQNKGTFEGWLTKIALNTVLMHLRQDKQFNKMLHQIPTEDSTKNTFDSDNETMSTRQLIQSIDFEANTLFEIINLLPEHHRTVFNLYVLEQFTHQQIAETLGISVGTSKSHLARARKKIQLILIQKATEMKQNQRKFMYLPILGTNASYLDKLFQKKLSNHVIQPKTLPPHLKHLFENAPIPMHTWAVYGFKGTISILTICIGLVTWKAFKTPLPSVQTSTVVTQKIHQMDFNRLQNANQVIDNQTIVQSKPILKPMMPILKPIEMRMDSPVPVIIKKQIILRDTIYQMQDDD